MCFLFILELSNILKLKVGVLTFLKSQKVNNQGRYCDGMFVRVGVLVKHPKSVKSLKLTGGKTLL